MNKNVRDMDETLKDSIKMFFREFNCGHYNGEAQDFVDELEEYLKEKGFDLGCIIQYKNNKL